YAGPPLDTSQSFRSGSSPVVPAREKTAGHVASPPFQLSDDRQRPPSQMFNIFSNNNSAVASVFTSLKTTLGGEAIDVVTISRQEDAKAALSSLKENLLQRRASTGNCTFLALDCKSVNLRSSAAHNHDDQGHQQQRLDVQVAYRDQRSAVKVLSFDILGMEAELQRNVAEQTRHSELLSNTSSCSLGESSALQACDLLLQLLQEEDNKIGAAPMYIDSQLGLEYLTGEAFACRFGASVFQERLHTVVSAMEQGTGADAARLLLASERIYSKMGYLVRDSSRFPRKELIHATRLRWERVARFPMAALQRPTRFHPISGRAMSAELHEALGFGMRQLQIKEGEGCSTWDHDLRLLLAHIPVSFSKALYEGGEDHSWSSCVDEDSSSFSEGFTQEDRVEPAFLKLNATTAGALRDIILEAGARPYAYLLDGSRIFLNRDESVIVREEDMTPDRGHALLRSFAKNRQLEQDDPSVYVAGGCGTGREREGGTASTKFGSDNRAGISACLHRISCIRSRESQIYSLTYRVGRAIVGNANFMLDLLKPE
ncbi:unnamed protein product, partial [Amoebophrya sp. A25]